jgi:fatty-acid O-methyltransferase
MILRRWVSPGDVLFLNFAYEEDPPMGLELEPADERDRGCIRLYHATASQVDLNRKKVLEIGCGHGGGASYIKRHVGPASYTGLDLNPSGITFCNKRHTLPGLDFVQAMPRTRPSPTGPLPLWSMSNPRITMTRPPSSAKWPARCAREAISCTPTARPPPALKSGSMLANAPLRKLSRRDINAETMRGMEKHSQHRVDTIERHAPSFLRNALRDGAPVAGGNYQGLKAVTTTYRVHLFVKD